MRAAMVGGAGYAVGRRAAQRGGETSPTSASTPPPAPDAPAPAAPEAPGSEADRVDALTKLKDLLDSGVLTEEQYEAEKQKLLEGL